MVGWIFFVTILIRKCEDFWWPWASPQWRASGVHLQISLLALAVMLPLGQWLHGQWLHLPRCVVTVRSILKATCYYIDSISLRTEHRCQTKKNHRTILDNSCVFFQVRWMMFQNDSEKTFSCEVVFSLLTTAEISSTWGAIFLGKGGVSAICRRSFNWDFFFQSDVWWLGFWDFLIHEKRYAAKATPKKSIKSCQLHCPCFRILLASCASWMIQNSSLNIQVSTDGKNVLPYAGLLKILKQYASEGWHQQLEICVQTECVMCKLDFFQYSKDVFIF